MLRSELVAALQQRRDNYVHVDVGGHAVPVHGVDYNPADNRISIQLNPVVLKDILAVIAEDGIAQLRTWRMGLRARFAAMIVAGEATVQIRAGHHERRGLAEGHLILFDTDHPAHPSILVYVEGVTRYSTLAELLDHHDPTQIAGPGATRAEVMAALTDVYPQPLPNYLAIKMVLLNPAPPQPPTAVDATGFAVIAE